jgi:hypothetical protein
MNTTQTAEKIIAAAPIPGAAKFEILVGQFGKSGAYFVARNRRGLGYVHLSRHSSEAAARAAANVEWIADRDAMRKAA